MENTKTHNILMEMESIGYYVETAIISHSMTLYRASVGAMSHMRNGKGTIPEHIPVVLSVNTFNPERKQS